MSTIFADKFKNTSGGNNVRINQLSGIDTAGSVAVQGEGTATTNLQQGLAKSWTNIDGGSGTPVIRDSFNHSTLTDNGTGDYTLALSNSMGNVDYSLQVTGSGTATGAASVFNRKLTVYTASAIPTTSQYVIASGYNYYTASNFLDNHYNFTEVQGDLA